MVALAVSLKAKLPVIFVSELKVATADALKVMSPPTLVTPVMVFVLLPERIRLL